MRSDAMYLLVEYEMKEVPTCVLESLAWKAMSDKDRESVKHSCRIMSCSLESGAFEARKEYGDEIDGAFCCIEEGLLKVALAGWDYEDMTCKLNEEPYVHFFSRLEKSRIVKMFLLSKKA